jgi:proteasome lid subunit RPN8/RPN11
MLQALVSTAGRLLNDLNRSLFRDRLVPVPVELPGPPAARTYERLERVVLTDEVSRTLFEEYAGHRAGARGDEETGWVLLGLREVNEALVLATLPAGAGRNAGVAHVRFNCSGQALASRIVRQQDRRLTMLGVVHTHPGSLRHPSDGDFQGDSQWVGRLRGAEGVFGIGTADGPPPSGTVVALQPRPHVQCLGELCISWYVLGDGERRYRTLGVGLTLGPDLARPLHPVWSMIEAHAEPLDRLCRQQAGVTFQVVSGLYGPALAVNLALAEPGSSLRLVMERKEVRYYLVRGDELLVVDPHESQVDRGVYLLLAELAGQG